jgi:hypothetical protein
MDTKQSITRNMNRIEFGKNSPVGTKCHDRFITLYDLSIPPDELILLQSINYYKDDPKHFTEDEKEVLSKLDKYLDIPLIQAIFDNESSYESFIRLFNNQCTVIPNKFYHNHDILEKVIEKDSLERFLQIIQLFHNPDPKKINIYAARYGRIDILEYGWPNQDVSSKFELATEAATNGHIDCLQWLHQHGAPLYYISSSNAAKNGHLSCLKYLIENGCRFDQYIASQAAEYGHLDCLQYLNLLTSQGFLETPGDWKATHPLPRKGLKAKDVISMFIAASSPPRTDIYIYYTISMNYKFAFMTNRQKRQLKVIILNAYNFYMTRNVLSVRKLLKWL